MLRAVEMRITDAVAAVDVGYRRVEGALREIHHLVVARQEESQMGMVAMRTDLVHLRASVAELVIAGGVVAPAPTTAMGEEVGGWKVRGGRCWIA